MRYQEITELFDNKAGWKWTRSSDHETTADFSIGDAFYQVGFGIVAHDGYGNNPTWEVAFEDSDGDFNLTGNGNAFAVFATVADIILDFIKKANFNFLLVPKNHQELPFIGKWLVSWQQKLTILVQKQNHMVTYTTY
jgi:hypothetical protein